MASTICAWERLIAQDNRYLFYFRLNRVESTRFFHKIPTMQEFLLVNWSSVQKYLSRSYLSIGKMTNVLVRILWWPQLFSPCLSPWATVQTNGALVPLSEDPPTRLGFQEHIVTNSWLCNRQSRWGRLQLQCVITSCAELSYYQPVSLAVSP